MTAAGPRTESIVPVMLALVICQCGLHACMSGMRIAIPLQALQLHYSKVSIGIIASCFAVVPALLALRFGRFTDRRGYHLPTTLAALLSLLSALIGFASDAMVALMLAAGCCGAGSGFGMIAIQRTASRLARSAAERLQIFSWIALAPALGGLVGPLLTGGLVDYAGFRPAFLALLLLPLLSLLCIRWVPREVMPASAPGPAPATSALDLLQLPLLRRLLLINLLVVACWDVHSFALPILGHERAFSATLIGAVFASYSAAALLVRGLLPALVRHLPQTLLPALGLGLIGLIFALYPLLTQAWMLMLAAAAFGLVLGVVQPTIMTLLHDCAPPRRQGETLALRSMFNQLTMTLLPLLYGGIGAVMGAAFMFWIMALGLLAGAWQASYFFRFPSPVTEESAHEQ